MALDFNDTAMITADVYRNGVATDPTTIQCQVRNPNASITTYIFGVDGNLTKVSIGRYNLSISVGVAGEWKYKWTSAGIAPGVEEGSFIVNPAGF